MSRTLDRLKKGKSTIRKIKTPPNSNNKPHSAREIISHKHGDHLNAPISEIKPDPDQPRKEFDAAKLQDLSKSISDKGVLQPLLIRFSDGQFWIVAGERRYRAAKMAGLKNVPCIVTTGDPGEISIIENIQREDLKPIELANALEQMMDLHGYNQSQLGKILGKSRQTISEMLRINKLPEEAKDILSGVPDISRRTIVEISKEEPKEALKIAKQVEEQGITSQEIRQNRGSKRIVRRSEIEIFNDKSIIYLKALQSIDDPKLFIKQKAILQKIRDQIDRFLK